MTYLDDLNDYMELDGERDEVVADPKSYPDQCPKCLACFCDQCVAKMQPEQIETLEGNFCPYCETELV